MKQRHMGARLWGALLGCLFLCLALAPAAWAQQTQGTVSVTVADSSGAVVPGASLSLTDTATNDTRTAVTQDKGNYTFVNLNFGQYKLTVSLQGFTTQNLRRAGAVRAHHRPESHVESRRRGRTSCRSRATRRR